MKRSKYKISVFWLGGLGLILASGVCLYFLKTQEMAELKSSMSREPSSLKNSVIVTPEKTSVSPQSQKPQAPETKTPDSNSPAQPAPSRQKDEEDGNELLAQEDSLPDSSGKWERHKLFKTKMAYPLVRVDEKIQKTSKGDQLISKTSYVADHVMVSLSPGKTEADLIQVLKKMGGQIRSKVPYSPLYLVSFDAKDFQRLDQIMADLRSSEVVQSPEKDFLVTAY